MTRCHKGPDGELRRPGQRFCRGGEDVRDCATDGVGRPWQGDGSFLNENRRAMIEPPVCSPGSLGKGVSNSGGSFMGGGGFDVRAIIAPGVFTGG